MAKKLVDQRLLRLQLAVPQVDTVLMWGLQWSPMREKSVARQAKAGNRSYTHHVMLPGVVKDVQPVVGLYAPPASDDGRKLPAGAIAAAHAFALLVREVDPYGALALQLPDQRYYVVCLSEGFVTTDSICADSAAALQMTAGASNIWTNNDVDFPGQHEASWGWLCADSVPSRLKPIPVDPRTVGWIAVVAVVAAAIAAGAFVWNKRQVEKRRVAAAMAAAAADPAPKYSAAIAAALPQAVYNTAAWKETWTRLMSAELTAPGWRRAGFICEASLKRCESAWSRSGGTSPELEDQLKADGDTVVFASDLQSAISLKPIVISQKPLEPSRLADAVAWRVANSALLQNWINAGFNPQLTAPSLWPAVDGVTPDYRAPDTIGAMKLAITVPGAFAGEVMDSQPDVSWTRLAVTVSQGETRNAVKVQLEGVLYVKIK